MLRCVAAEYIELFLICLCTNRKQVPELGVYAGSTEGPMGVGQKGGNATYSLGRWVGGGGTESEKEEDCKGKNRDEEGEIERRLGE